MKQSLKGNIFRMFGMKIQANRADADSEKSRLLIAEHSKPENSRARKVLYEEIMGDLATGTPGRLLDRKVQAYMSGDLWPPTSMTETFDTVETNGHNNAWTTSGKGVEKMLMLSHSDVYQSMRLEFSPFTATCAIDGRDYRVRGKSAAMTMMMVHILASRLRYNNDDRKAAIGSDVGEIRS